MHLENSLYNIDITVDATYTVDSADNKPYDLILNPGGLRRKNWPITFAIEITCGDEKKRLALIGDYSCGDMDCAVLNGNLLTVLQNHTITRLDVQSTAVVLYKHFDRFGCWFTINACPGGYIIYGELDIVKLNYMLDIVWEFSGADIFVTQDYREPFEMTESTIELWDWQNNRYVLDFDGNLIDSTLQ